MACDALGWQTIERELVSIYGEAEPQHWGTVVRFSTGGDDPLDGVSAYDAGDHWHYVSYGLTELYEKVSKVEEQSGWGFELTFRLSKGGTGEAPVWPVMMLQSIARYVYSSGNPLMPGDYMDLNGPLAENSQSALSAVAVGQDVELPNAINGPHGVFGFHQLVGITADELAAAMSWNTAGLLDLVAKRQPKLVTDLGRRSLLSDPDFAREVEEGRKREGSSTGATYCEQLAFKKVGLISKKLRVVVGAIVVPSMRDVLPGRIPFRRPYVLVGEGCTVRFLAGTPRWEIDEDGAAVYLDPVTAQALAETLLPRRGDYQLPGLAGVIFEVVPTPIRGADGQILETRG